MILADRVLAPGWVSVGDGRIEASATDRPARELDVDCQGLWLAPGFVDMHVHGGGGGAFDSGDEAEITRAARFTAPTAPPRSSRAWSARRWMRSSDRSPALATCVAEGIVAGIHLEGPWLSPAAAWRA